MNTVLPSVSSLLSYFACFLSFSLFTFFFIHLKQWGEQPSSSPRFNTSISARMVCYSVLGISESTCVLWQKPKKARLWSILQFSCAKKEKYSCPRWNAAIGNSCKGNYCHCSHRLSCLYAIHSVQCLACKTPLNLLVQDPFSFTS